MQYLTKGLLSSLLFFVFPLSESYGQDLVPEDIFDRQGGIEIVLDDSALLTQLDKHEGLTIDHGCSHQTPHMYAIESGYKYLIEQNIGFRYIQRPKAEITMLGPNELPVYKSE